MKIVSKSILFILVLSCVACINLKASENTVSGALIINDKPVKMDYVYTDKGPNDIMVVFTDVSVPEDNIPFGVAGLAIDGKVQGMVLTINTATKELDKQGYNVLYHKVWEGQLGTIGNGVLKIDKLDDKVIEGTIKTPSPNTYTNQIEEKTYTYSYDIKFKAKVVKRDIQ